MAYSENILHTVFWRNEVLLFKLIAKSSFKFNRFIAKMLVKLPRYFLLYVW